MGKKDFVVFCLITLVSLLVWKDAFSNFFAQDDFIFIEHFAKNNLWQNIENVFGPPQVTHWRPMHNLYFLIAGTIFGKNYVGYHALTFLLHTGAGFFIYKIANFLLGKTKPAILASLLYVVHPAHFNSLFWISGGAGAIGIFFLILSSYWFVLDKKIGSFISFILALLASEAMIVGLVIFTTWSFLKGKLANSRLYLILLAIISTIFIAVKILSGLSALGVYRLELSLSTLWAGKYYLLRTLGFAETSADRIASGILAVLWVVFLLFTILTRAWRIDLKMMAWSVTIIIVGFFPFILLPGHLSPHYMNISIWGLVMLFTTSMQQLKNRWAFAMVVIFTLVAISNVLMTMKNNWVITRSNLAKQYFQVIKDSDIPYGTTIIFANSNISSSEEAYVTLGKGLGIKMWFADKNYTYCFERFDNCDGITSDKYKIME